MSLKTARLVAQGVMGCSYRLQGWSQSEGMQLQTPGMVKEREGAAKEWDAVTDRLVTARGDVFK